MFKKVNENVDNHVKHISHIQTNIRCDTNMIKKEF